jgi:hypothetical protein
MKTNEMIGFYLKAIDYEILISKSKYLNPGAVSKLFPNPDKPESELFN